MGRDFQSVVRRTIGSTKNLDTYIRGGREEALTSSFGASFDGSMLRHQMLTFKDIKRSRKSHLSSGVSL